MAIRKSYASMMMRALDRVGHMPYDTLEQRQERANTLAAAIRAWELQATGSAESS